MIFLMDSSQPKDSMFWCITDQDKRFLLSRGDRDKRIYLYRVGLNGSGEAVQDVSVKKPLIHINRLRGMEMMTREQVRSRLQANQE